MKKNIILLASVLLSFSLTSCDFSIAPATSSGGNTTTSQKEETSTPKQDNSVEEANSTNTNVSTPSQESKEKVTFPTNFTMKCTMTSCSKPYEVYKIDKEWMIVFSTDITYIKPNNSGYSVYIGELSGGTVEWDSTPYDYSTLYSSLGEVKELAQFADPDSFLVNYASKTSDELTITGVECVKYYESDFKYEYYIEEDTGICFKQVVAGMTFEVTEYTKSCSSFPYSKPE